jgi:uncharacterized repeat protein (TIGR01451 family)
MESRKSVLTAVLLLTLLGGMIWLGKGTPPSFPVFLFKSPPPSSDEFRTAWGQMSLYFIENRGQFDPEVAYSLPGKDKTLYFTSQGVTFSLTDTTPKTNLEELLPHFSLLPKVEASIPEKNDSPLHWNLKLDFIGANPHVRPLGKDPTSALISYFKGTKDQWKTGLKTYSSIVYPELWPGIDLVYSGTANQMKYTFVVRPGADPNRIQLAYRGVTGMTVNDAGQLEIITPVRKFHDASPEAYQEVNGKRIGVPTTYALDSKTNKDRHIYGFRVGSYDKAQALIIDPAVFVYAGFIGGTAVDVAHGIAVDGAGNAYITGEVSGATNFPIAVGPDTSFNGSSDAFVAKVKADGSGLDYAGFIGGQQVDVGAAIAVDGQGNAYITGTTNSNSTTDGFPALVGPVTNFGGGMDAFVAKISADGTQLLYAGYIGGALDENSDDRGGIAVDKDGNAYVTGFTFSNEDPNDSVNGKFPVKVGPDTTFNGFVDVFVSKIKPDGSDFVYSGYIGGTDQEHGNGIAVDKDGNAYVTGDTFSATGFPLITGPSLTFGGGVSPDAFVTKVKADGTGFVYSGYIGGSSFDEGNGIAVDGSGNAYITGQTDSDESTFPVTVGPDTSFNGSGDAFVAKVKADGSGLDYAGYIGGSQNDTADGIAVDGAGNAYVVGTTASDQNSFPVTEGPDLTFHGTGGNNDAFIAKVKADGTGFGYAGYIGGSGNDIALGIAVDGHGNAYVAGATDSDQGSFPVKGGPSLIQNGSIDAFVAKISENIDVTVAIAAAPDPVEVGDDLTYTITVTNNGPVVATGVILTDPIPAAADFVSASPATCSDTNGTVTCNIPDLASGANIVVTMVIKPRTRGTLTNTATVTANENDENSSNNSASVDTTVNEIGGGGGGGGCRLNDNTNEGTSLIGWALIGLAIMGTFWKKAFVRKP